MRNTEAGGGGGGEGVRSETKGQIRGGDKELRNDCDSLEL